jgi:periplasmic protein TonB
MLRFITLTPVGFLLLLCVLWLMAKLIEPQQRIEKNEESLISVDFIRSTPSSENRQKPEITKNSAPQKQEAPPPPRPQHIALPTIKLPTQGIDVALQTIATPKVTLNKPTSLNNLAFENSPLQNHALHVNQPLPLEQSPLVASNLTPIRQIKPMYPAKARRRNIEGWVKIGFVITSEGRVTDAHLIDSQPPHVFDNAALKAISRWKFKPQLIAGIPQQRSAEQKMVFKLN